MSVVSNAKSSSVSNKRRRFISRFIKNTEGARVIKIAVAFSFSAVDDKFAAHGKGSKAQLSWFWLLKWVTT